MLYCFAYVGSSVRLSVHWLTKLFPIIILKTIHRRAFIFHVLIGLCEDKTLLILG